MSIQKAYRMTGELAENRLRGAAAVMGNMDRMYDVIMPGAFRKVLPEFLKAGFVSDTHSWDMADVVAMPVAAQERGRELLVEAEFHTDDAAQAVRAKCAERLAAGLSVGLSVGFASGDDMLEFSSGKQLLKDAEERGADMGLLDVAGIRRRTNWCRAIYEIAELYEFSIVPVPANPEARMTDIKGAGCTTPPTTVREFEQVLRDAGFSRADATAIASHGFNALLRDAGESGAVTTCGLDEARLALARFRTTLVGRSARHEQAPIARGTDRGQGGGG